MWKLVDIKSEKDGEFSLFQRVEQYILGKNLNFIVARGKLLNMRHNELGHDKVVKYLNGYAACDFSMVSLFNGEPSAPFIAADMNPAAGIARVCYLMDFNEEAKDGAATSFYSKLMGAFATNFFVVQPGIEKLWFPFIIKDLVGSRMGIQLEGSGTFITKKFPVKNKALKIAM